ncbi:gluconate 2-dehydrogenase subunit 3 family protein [Sphingomonas sp. 37zxx]|uniref:gluconate 2-dehydrogenase subunit 3 family protein n=1 Tax=Sphingomonas sp. 37zxx TaxID=1550073 RepID=UPI00053BE816|nr:gluconate 2-dehydrogenase subunit 3 family protein [Sphingomonas sp. 37zxx]
MIDRRTALAGALVMFGAQIFAPIARAAGQSVPRIVPATGEGPPSEAVFTPMQRALVVALSERVIPTTDTPGAIAAEVPAYIEKLLADWSAPDERKPIIAGLNAIEARSLQDFQTSAATALPEQQDALLTLAMNGEIPGGKLFFIPFRQLVIAGYYTSEIGITQEREYLPIPGSYDGAFPYSGVSKIYSF